VGQLQQQAVQMEQHYVGQLQVLQQQYDALAQASAAAEGVGMPGGAKHSMAPLEQQGSAQHSMARGLPGSSRALVSDAVNEGEGLLSDADAAAVSGSSTAAGELTEITAGEESPAGGVGQRQPGGVVRRERAAGGSVVVNIDMAAAGAAAAPGGTAAEAAGTGSSSISSKAGSVGGVVGQVLSRVTRVASSVAAAVRAAEGRAGSSSLDGGYDSDDEGSGEVLPGRSPRSKQGLLAVGLNRQKLQLGALRPFGAIPAVRSAHPQVQGVLARADGAWVRVLRIVSSSPLSRVGVMGYLLLLHVLVLWVRASCHPAMQAAAMGGLGAAGAGAAPFAGLHAAQPAAGGAVGGLGAAAAGVPVLAQGQAGGGIAAAGGA
jgi:hypothetical protein